jgi:hypothetical protein
VPRFKVRIDGDQLTRAMATLNGAGVPTIGIFPAYRVEAGPPEDTDLFRLTAVVDAETADGATSRVREVLPADADYKVGDAEPWQAEADG